MQSDRSNTARRLPVQIAACMLMAVAAFGCDRAVEPYVPGEKPEQPDLSRIFPEGAERAAENRAGAMGRARSAAAGSARADSPAAPVSGTIALSPDFEARVPTGAILFLIARTSAAAARRSRSSASSRREFPIEFSLGPDDRMIKTVPFEGPLQLSVRLDADGNAMTRAAQAICTAKRREPHQPGESGVAIVIDQVF